MYLYPWTDGLWIMDYEVDCAKVLSMHGELTLANIDRVGFHQVCCRGLFDSHIYDCTGQFCWRT